MDSLAKAVATTTGHALGCSCTLCYRERKRLRDEAEADRRADLEAALPPAGKSTRGWRRGTRLHHAYNGILRSIGGVG